jgi:hypothetical protein
VVFWVVTPFSLVGGCQLFGETYCLHHQAICSSEKSVTAYKATQKTTI